MSNYLFITGRQPALSQAEIEARLPKAASIEATSDGLLLSTDEALDQDFLDQLGGTMKLIELTKTIPQDDIISGLSDLLFEHYHDQKLDYGVSVYGMNESILRTWLLKLKKKLRADGLKTRFINNHFENISAAQYKSIKDKGIELCVIKHQDQFWVGKVVGVQDIDAYSQRDFDKPFRDMHMGMLPPKLAQILVNLTGVEGTIWDPFCGSGTVVMEGLLMGHPMIGSDINPKHVDGAKKNVEWLRDGDQSIPSELFVHDATKPIPKISFDAIACEVDLGTPHGQSIRADELETIMSDLDQLYRRFFEQLKTIHFKGPVVVALPSFIDRKGKVTTMKNTLQVIEKLGFKNTLKELHYSRPGQAVGRAIYRFQLQP